jgi:hypothetical protein
MDLESFVQRLEYMYGESTRQLLDKSFIQDNINQYNRIFERRETIQEILEELGKFQSESERAAALKIKFSGTTII